MENGSITRKPRAILCADVQGSSRLMGEDQIGTYHTPTAYLEMIRQLISAHNGRVFSSPGDAVRAEFASVVDAVDCDLKIQANIESENASVSTPNQMKFRIFRTSISRMGGKDPSI